MVDTPLSKRLRQLRRSRWPGRPVNQARVAEALGVTSPSISAYENGVLPPLDRLHDYAVFFASRRWLDPGAPLPVDIDVLSPDERKTFDELNTELSDLRSDAEASIAPVAAATIADYWRFSDGGPVRILCGRLDAADPVTPYASPDDHNFMALRSAADLDSLIELFGHIRAQNPVNDVRFIVGGDYTADDVKSHVVVIGNVAQMQGKGRLLPDGAFPVRQVRVPGLDGEVFETDRSGGGTDTFGPVLDGGRVVEDVGFLARVPNPHFTTRTFTVCSGVFTRGVYGAVRTLTDEGLRNQNAAYLAESFPNPSRFGLLMRVRVAGPTVPTPDLRDKDNRLVEFPEQLS